MIEKLILKSTLRSYLSINLYAFEIIFKISRHFSLILNFLFSLFEFPEALSYIFFYNIFLNEPIDLIFIIYVKLFLSRSGFYTFHLCFSFGLVSNLLRNRGVSWSQYFSFLLFFIFISLFLWMAQYWHINVIIIPLWIYSPYYFPSSFRAIRKISYLVLQ